MMSNRRLRTISHGVFIGLLWITQASALAQSRLDAGILSNPNFWTPEQRQSVEAYVDQQLSAIQSGDESAVDRGRSNLTQPPKNPGANARFVEQFSQLVSGKIDTLMRSDQLKVRLNAMVICMNLTHPDALDAIRRGLADDSAGVRYPAAKAIEAQLASGQLDTAQTQQVLTVVQQLIVAEQDVYVVQPLFDALLAAPDNDTRVLGVLNERIARHIDRPQASFAPESAALLAINSRLVTAQNRPDDQVDQLARASARYFLIAAQQLAADAVPEGQNASHLDIIRVAAVSLQFAHGQRRSAQLAPASPNGPLNQQNWNALVGIAQDWIEVLKADPFNFTDAQLDVGSGTP